MPLDTQTYDAAREVPKIDEELAELGAETKGLVEGSIIFRNNVEKQQELNRHAFGLNWMVDKFGSYPDEEDAGQRTFEVTLGALTPREYAEFEDLAGSTDTDRQIAFVAAGTVEAPYLQFDPLTDDRTKENLVKTVNYMADETHRWFIKWAESRINELLRGEERDNPFWQSYAEAETESNGE